MPICDQENLRAKVDEFLSRALEEADLDVRSKLLGKAVHWTNMARMAERPRPPFGVGA